VPINIEGEFFMNEAALFKNGFWFGRVIWLKGSGKLKKNSRIAKLLETCSVLPSEVFYVNAEQFVDVFSRGLPKECLNRYEVVWVDGFENLESVQAEAFLKIIRTFCDFRMEHSLQLILASGANISPDLKNFSQFNPVEISIVKEGKGPGELNQQLHDLLTVAMQLSDINLHFISERAAVFLEEFLRDEGDDDTLVLILNALSRSNKKGLMLKDLFPQELLHPSYGSGAEAPCI
jgi:hypothetical protein